MVELSRGGVEHSEVLGRPVRSDPVAHLGRSTLFPIREAVAAERWEDCEVLLEYYRVQEIERMLDLYQLWLWVSLRWIAERLEPTQSVADVLVGTLERWVPTQVDDEATHDRLVDTGARMDGLLPALDPKDDAARVLVFRALGRSAEAEQVRRIGREQLPAALASRDAARLLDLLDQYVGAARAIHDDYSDWTWALATWVQQQYGEDTVEVYFRATLGPWTKSRTPSSQLRQMSALDNLRYTVEGMRAHFSGDERDGSIVVEERDDAYVLVLDPGGTCERMRRGDPLAGTGPRTEPPYSFGVTERAHPWSWGKAGVGLYSAHCCLVNEILPMEELGFPKRITECPDDDAGACRWLIYKDWGQLPASYFERVGLNPPVVADD